MFCPADNSFIDYPLDAGPFLIVNVDAEEEFDWAKLSSNQTGVTNLKYQYRAHKIFDSLGVVPTYALDYPVASQKDGYQPILELLQDRRCDIGAQLHSWVNPPIREDITARNSYAGHLEYVLEYEKLKCLSQAIENNLGMPPRVYRAGRYGAGPHTADILTKLGYKIDISVMPYTSFRDNVGPDYTKFSPDPFWFGENNDLLEIPTTVGLLGPLHNRGASIFSLTDSRFGRLMRINGFLSRSYLLNRVRLSPEGTAIEDAKHLARVMLQRGRRLFCISYHTPSLEPGNTPYVRSQKDLEGFLSWLEDFLEFFFDELKGQPSTARQEYERAEFWRRRQLNDDSSELEGALESI